MRTLRRFLTVVGSAAALASGVACGSGGGGAAGSQNADIVHIVTTSIPSATTGVAYAAEFDAHFPHSPGVYFVSGGNLPPGLTVDKDTGVVTGYPRQTGAFHFEIGARDGTDPSIPAGRDATFAEDRRTFSIQVALGPPHILPQLPPAAQYRSSYAYSIDVAGGTAPFTFAQTGGTLPAGLSVSASGVIGNFPTQGVPPNYAVDVTVTDANGLQDMQTLQLTVVTLPLLILTSSLPSAAKDFPYQTTLALASAGAGVPYTWTQKAPAAGEVDLATIGMEVTTDGRVRSQDSVAGPTLLSPPGGWLFTVRVTDEATQVAERQFSLTVNPGPTIVSVTPNNSAAAGPFTVDGLNFQPGAQVIFQPGPSQVGVTTTYLSTTQLRFASPVPMPAGGGAVTVRVLNPDGGFADRLNGFVFPFTNLTFGAKGFLPSALSSTGLACADLNGDGRAEIIHCGASGITPYSGAATSTSPGLHLYLNTGSLTFTDVTLDGGNYYDVKIADVNTDGKPDIVALGQTAIRVWINNPLGTFTAGPSSPIPAGLGYPSEMAMGLFNGDAIPDLAFGVAVYSNPNGRVYTMAGDGSGGFTLLSSAASSMNAANGVVSLTCVDINGDGRSDIFAGNGFDNGIGPMFQFALTSGTGQIGSWTSGATAPFYYANTLGVCAADFTGTGAPAVFLVHTEDATDGGGRAIRLFTGSTMSTALTLPSPAGLGKSVSAADLDYDGKFDAGLSSAPGVVSIYRGSTQAIVATLDAAAGAPAVTSPRTGRVAFGDLDGDGKIEVLATTSYWITDYQPNIWGTSYALNLAGNGGSMGVVYWTNTSN